MHRVSACVLVLFAAIGCSKKDAPAPTPAPTPGTAVVAPADSGLGNIGGAMPELPAGAADAATVDDGVREYGAGHDGRGLYYARALTAADLDGRSLRDLALMRNTIYARAGHTFRKTWLRDHFTAQPWYTPLPKDDGSKITATDRANAKLIAAREAAFPRDAMAAEQAALAAKAERSTADDVELRLLGEQLGRTVETAGDEPARSPLEDPKQLDRLLEIGELADLSRRDLRILRNTVYARHGRIFKSPVLQQWFDDKDWYEPDPSFDESRLTAIDKKNVRLIRSVEDASGGPMTDREQQDEDGWWDAA